jgi:hypothetical protein
VGVLWADVGGKGVLVGAFSVSACTRGSSMLRVEYSTDEAVPLPSNAGLAKTTSIFPFSLTTAANNSEALCCCDDNGRLRDASAFQLLPSHCH